MSEITTLGAIMWAEFFVVTGATIKGYWNFSRKELDKIKIRQIEVRKGEAGVVYLLRILIAYHADGVAAWWGCIRWLCVGKPRGESG